MRRVVVTGLGAITPLGKNVQDFWNALVNGESGSDLVGVGQHQFQRVLSLGIVVYEEKARHSVLWIIAGLYRGIKKG